jgi:hypothetical protein
MQGYGGLRTREVLAGNGDVPRHGVREPDRADASALVFIL